MANLFLWLIARIVPSDTRERWLEEWRAELAHGGSRMMAGALPDALAMRDVAARPRHWRGPWLTDTKQTLRSLARAPWHVATVTVCLGIGIAVTVTVFSILATILTGDMPGVRDRASLMRLYLTSDRLSGGRRAVDPASIHEFNVLRKGTTNMRMVAAEGGWHFALRITDGSSSLVRGAFVSGNYFDVLGTTPALGRLLLPSDDAADAPVAVVLSYAFWSAHFGARPDAIGSTVVVGGRDAVIVGVAPQFFSGTDVGDLGEPPGLRYRIYVPLAHVPTLARIVDPRKVSWLKVIGRADGQSDRQRLAAEFEPLALRIEAEDPDERKNAAVLIQPEVMGPSDTFAVVAVIILLMMAAPMTVLAIACANVANLQLVRATLRARELAVRSSLGASRTQLVRLLTIESSALALLAVTAGALGTHVLLRIVATVVPFHITIDRDVVVFVIAVAALVILVTGVIPGWLATTPGESLALTGGQRSTSHSISRLRRSLVVAQVALSLLLLLTAALFTRSLGFLAGRIPPIAHESVVAEIRFDTLGYEASRRESFATEIESRLSADTRVGAIGFSATAPFRRGGRRVWLPGDGEDVFRGVDAAEVSEGWFRAAGLTTLRGRTYVGEDLRSGHVVVNEAFVRRHRLEDPIGTVVRVDSIPTVRSITQMVDDTSRRVESVTIIGVVSNGLTRPLIPEPIPTLYLPLRGIPDYVSVYVRTAAPVAIQGRIPQLMAAIDPDLPAVSIATLADRFDEDAGDIRLLASAASGLGLSALALALAGVYSLVAFFVSLRTHEFGIRLAIGARPADIVRMVVLQASQLVGLGSIIGLLIGSPVLIGLSKAFPYTSAFDPIGVLVPLFGLMAAAVVAAIAPARRAARVDPCSALRSE